MKTLVIYDSGFGNTQKIAQSIADSIKGARLLQVSKVTPSDLKGLDLLIVGSPTYGGRPTEKLQYFLSSLPYRSLKNIKIAAFDTRFDAKKLPFLLRLLLKTIDYAAPKIHSGLVDKGGQPFNPPIGFFVLNKEGPLREREINRASDWAKSLSKL